ncbi:MAG: carboxypeptidase-like regulatory domain-containing protein [Pseudonocardia sp.]|nr:carboxypeptidase-like regulatory domain-containing protein [Pseudonocardia sp.]
MVVSTAPDHQPGAVAVTVTDTPVDADVLLAPSASLAGTVYSEDGPVLGAKLTLVQDGEVVDAVDSGDDGAYRIGDLAAGDYELSVSADGCEPVTALLDVPDATDLRHDVDLDPAGLPADGVAAGNDLIDDLIGHH